MDKEVLVQYEPEPGRGEHIYRRGRVRSRLREASRARQPRCVVSPVGDSSSSILCAITYATVLVLV